MQKLIRFTPAFDKRNPDPKQNYGIHGVELQMFLIGDEGAIQFKVFTNWMLPHVQAEFDVKPCNGHSLLKPMPADIGYHSKLPLYDGEKPIQDDCEFTGGACYYDGSGLQADEVFKVLVVGGDDACWAEMEKYYNKWLRGKQAA